LANGSSRSSATGAGYVTRSAMSADTSSPMRVLATSESQTLICPSCGSSGWRDRGRIPPASEFAGQLLVEPLAGGRLLECRACGLNWRSVSRPAAFYDALYARARGAEWQSTPRRPDHDLIVEKLQQHQLSGDVLDVGCGTGALLARLPKQFRRYGIEIGQEARAIAESHGVEVIGSDFADLDRLARSFDAIVACDVIEHCANPRQFLDAVMRRLKPGGLFVLSTGDASAWLWRLCGGRFWYCHFAEHLSFISPHWLAKQSSAGTELVDVQRFTYGSADTASRVKLTLLLAWYMTSPGSFGRWLARRRGLTGDADFHPNPPGQGLSRDHLVAVLQRAPSQRCDLTA
jgi:SAM-dependent methyltransferase